MSDRDDLAQVLSANWRNMHTNEALGYQRMLADAIIAAGWRRADEMDRRDAALRAVTDLLDQPFLDIDGIKVVTVSDVRGTITKALGGEDS